MQTSHVLQIFRASRRNLLNKTHINSAIKQENETLGIRKFVFH